jgi:hypothetical protein
VRVVSRFRRPWATIVAEGMFTEDLEDKILATCFIRQTVATHFRFLTLGITDVEDHAISRGFRKFGECVVSL